MSARIELNNRRTLAKSILLLVVVLFVLLLIVTAWTCDDSMISLRVAYNLVHGYGLRWNIDERVQVFTNPLWTLLLAAFFALTSSPFLSLIVPSLLFAAATVVLIAYGERERPVRAAAIVILLCCSKAFIDFSTSGLENVLIHFLLVVGYLLYSRSLAPSRRSVFWLTFSSALLACTRLDAILFLLPAVVVECRSVRRFWIPLLGGAVPLLAWLCFATIYYGFPLPNTFYAKVVVPLGPYARVHSAMYYLWHSLTIDPLTLLLLAVSIAVVLIDARTNTRRHASALSMGALLYLLYFFQSGGDFMSGRFLSAPFLLGILSLAQTELFTMQFAGVIALLALGTSFAIERSPLRSGPDYGQRYAHPSWDAVLHTNDERAGHYLGTNLFSIMHGYPYEPSFATDGRRVGRSGAKIVVHPYVGALGFYAGPMVHIVDPLGLGDPLLARMMPHIEFGWQSVPGHYRRRIPQGYVRSIITGSNCFLDKGLGRYYFRLREVTSGSIWSRKRLRILINFIMGRYDNLPRVRRGADPRFSQFRLVRRRGRPFCIPAPK